MAENKTIITIGRQYGSGGHEIGATLAHDLGLKLYDKEMLKRAAKESGLCEELFETHDEKPTYSFLYSLVMDSYSAATHNGMPLNHQLFLEQYNTIKKLAEENSCVLIGRCADYALADNPDAIHIFIYADEDAKTKRIMEKYDLSETKAREMCVKKDKQRQSYYNYYSSKKWGRADSYDLCINSSVLGVEGTVKLITQYIEDFENKNKDN